MDTTRTIPTTAPAAPRTGYERTVWERALLASELRRDLRLVGLILAHHATVDGRLPIDGPQRVESLCALAHINGKNIRVILRELECAGFLRRPNLATWRNRQASRPIALTLPATAAGPGHLGEAEE